MQSVIKKEEVKEENKQEIAGFLYEQSKIADVLNALNTIPVSGLNQIKAMNMIFDVLTMPIPFQSGENDQKSKTE